MTINGVAVLIRSRTSTSSKTNTIFTAASNSELAFTIILNSPQTKRNSDQLSAFIGVSKVFSLRISLSSLLFWTPFQKVLNRQFYTPRCVEITMRRQHAQNQCILSFYGRQLPCFFLGLRPRLAPRFARRLARGLRQPPMQPPYFLRRGCIGG